MAELAWPYGATALDAVGEDSGAEILVSEGGRRECRWGLVRAVFLEGRPGVLMSSPSEQLFGPRVVLRL
jgi:hypothetical protein